MSENFLTPEWVKHAVFYQIFPDRFATSSRVEKPSNLEPWDTPPSVFGFKGGDLLGVVERLNYLQDLGINAIYFNPVFQSASNHRYHTHDYFHIDPLLGGDKAFRTLLDEAHRRGLRVILDGVFNHASRGFFQFNHILETGPSSPYLNWFNIKRFPLNAYRGKPNYQCWYDLAALPEFNTDNPQVRHFIFDVANYWLEQGIDGWRLDVPMCIDDDIFWYEFRQVVKSANPEAYIVGEIPGEAQRWLQGDQFDAVMNYQFAQACLGFFAGESIDRELEKGLMGLPPTPVLEAARFAERAGQLLTLYPRQAALAQFNLLDSHDTPRFLTLASGDKSALRLAVLFQMTYPGAPCIYYGDEIGMDGGKGHYPEASRYSFTWDENRWDTDLRQHYQRCIALRNSHPALRTGEFVPLCTQGQLFAFIRQLEEDKLVVIINNDIHSAELDLIVNDSLPESSHWRDLLEGAQVQVIQDRLVGPRLPPRSAFILVPGAL